MSFKPHHFLTVSRRWGFPQCLLITFLGLIASHLSAQVYTLDEAVTIALQNNKQMVNDQLSAQAAYIRIGEMKSAMLPRIEINNQYQYYFNVPEQYAPASNFGGPEGEYALMRFNLEQNISSGIQISQSVINPEARAKAASARASYNATVIQSTVSRESLTYNVMATYYTIQVTQDNLARIADNIRNLEKTVEINEVLKSNDLIASNVHHRLLINLQNLRNAYENQQLYLTQQVARLKYLMNLDQSDSLAVVPFEYDKAFEGAIGLDLFRRPDIRLQQAQIEMAQADLKLIRARYAPTVTGSFYSGMASYYDAFAPYRQINDDWINNTYVAVNVRIPVFAGFQKRFQVGQQKLSIQRNVNSLSMLQLHAEEEAHDARETYATHKTQVINTKNSLDLAQKLFDSAQGDYVNGISTITDLLNAQNDLTDARTNYSNALLNLRLAELSLKKAYGVL